MTTLRKGDVLFRQGDDSDPVLRVRSGELEVIRESGRASFTLGHVLEGEWLGEMGVIERLPRSATVRAIADGTVEVSSAQEFLDRVSHDPALARELILRLSIRLRKVGVVGSRSGKGHTKRRLDHSDRLTDRLRSQIGSSPINISSMPFVVGQAD